MKCALSTGVGQSLHSVSVDSYHAFKLYYLGAELLDSHNNVNKSVIVRPHGNRGLTALRCPQKHSQFTRRPSALNH